MTITRPSEASTAGLCRTHAIRDDHHETGLVVDVNVAIIAVDFAHPVRDRVGEGFDAQRNTRCLLYQYLGAGYSFAGAAGIDDFTSSLLDVECSPGAPRPPPDTYGHLFRSTNDQEALAAAEKALLELDATQTQHGRRSAWFGRR